MVIVYIGFLIINFVYIDYSCLPKQGHTRSLTVRCSHNRGSPTPQPIEVGKEYEVDITEIRRQGDGTIVDPYLIK